jgi:hypothetical protein
VIAEQEKVLIFTGFVFAKRATDERRRISVIANCTLTFATNYTNEEKVKPQINTNERR